MDILSNFPKIILYLILGLLLLFILVTKWSLSSFFLCWWWIWDPLRASGSFIVSSIEPLLDYSKVRISCMTLISLSPLFLICKMNVKSSLYNREIFQRANNSGFRTRWIMGLCLYYSPLKYQTFVYCMVRTVNTRLLFVAWFKPMTDA